jgi:4-hydroxy-tetrahydrodipicolinate synthase
MAASLSSVDDLRRRMDASLIPAVPVPFTASGEIDAAAQQRYAAWMAKQPVAGVAVWAHTGRGLHLRREQRIKVLGSWKSGLNPNQFVVAGVGGSPEHREDFSAYLDSAAQMAQDALDHGAQAFLVHPPRLFHHVAGNRELIVKYHRRLAALGAPLILFYLYEAAGGIPYTPEILRELLALPETVGIKLATLDSVMTFQNIANLLADEFPEKLLITGEDRFLPYSLMCGARAALIGMGAACCGLQHGMIQSYFAGRAAEFLALARKVDRLGQVVFVPPVEGYIRRMLWTLVHLGVIGRESAHDPWGPELPESEFKELGKVLRALGETPSTATAAD